MRDDRHSLRNPGNRLAGVLGGGAGHYCWETQDTRRHGQANGEKKRGYVHLVLTLGRKDPGGHTHAGNNHQADDDTPSARVESKTVSSESQRGSATETEGLEY